MASSSSSSTAPPATGWAALPHDVLWSIFTELRQCEVLSGAGLACVAWRRLARDEPALWRRIDLTIPEDDDDTADEDVGKDLSISDDDSEAIWGSGLFDDSTDNDMEKASSMDDDESLSDEEEGGDDTVDDDEKDAPIFQEETPAVDSGDSSGWKAMVLADIDRSAGQCEAFWGRADDEVLLYLADRASSVKSLRLTSHYDVSSEVFTDLIKKFTLLEELELVLKYDTNNYPTKSAEPSSKSWLELFQSACKSCSHLRHFKVRDAANEQRSGRYYSRGPRSPKPFSIPMMHGLQSFELSGDSSFTQDVAMRIVDKCPNLKSLNISDVRYKDKWELKLLNNKCYKIKDLKLPAVFYEPETDYSSDDDLS
ncbi:unnamed protein product [Urochloa humidicola]